MPWERSLTPLTEEQRRLVNDNINFAFYYANKLRRRYGNVHDFDPDEIDSAAMIGLMYAAQKYDPSRSKFVTFASFVIRSAIQNTLDHANRKRRFHLQRRDLPDHLPCKEEDNPYAAEDVDLLLNTLPQWKRVPFRLWANGYTQREVAQMMGCGSHQAVRHRITSGIETIHKTYPDRNSICE